MQYCHYYMMIMLLTMVVMAMIIVVGMVVVMVMGRCSMTLTAAAENYSHLCLLSSTSYIGQVMCIFCRLKSILNSMGLSRILVKSNKQLLVVQILLQPCPW